MATGASGRVGAEEGVFLDAATLFEVMAEFTESALGESAEGNHKRKSAADNSKGHLRLQTGVRVRCIATTPLHCTGEQVSLVHWSQNPLVLMDGTRECWRGFYSCRKPFIGAHSKGVTSSTVVRFLRATAIDERKAVTILDETCRT